MLDIALPGGVPMGFGDLTLEGDDRVRLRLRLGNPGEAMQRHDIVAIGGAIAVILLAREQIIIAVGHAEAVLVGGSNVVGRVGRIGQDADADRRLIARRREQAQQVRSVAHGGDPVEPGMGRGNAARLDARFVHPAGVEAADLAAGRVGSAALDNRADLALDILVQHGPQAVAGTVGRDRIVLEPGVVGEAPEIVARL